MFSRVSLALGFSAALSATLISKEIPAPVPFPATRVTIEGNGEPALKSTLDQLRRSGISVEAPDISLKDSGTFVAKPAPAWEALEAIAAATGTRLDVLDHGRRVALVKRDGPPEPSCVRGPFRIVAKQVQGRRNLATGNSFQEVELLVHWEPRYPVYRIDAVPRITTATDDLGNALTAASASVLSPVNGAASHVLPVRLLNVTRKAQTIAELAGDFTITASERLLPFRFANLGGKLPVDGTLPMGVKADGVKAVLADWSAIRINDAPFWEATVHLSYPEGMPVFQSFETWLGENKIRLVTPQGVAIAPDQIEEPLPAREMTMAYRFSAAKLPGKPVGAGWSLVYDTPAPLTEFKVPFSLKQVPLP